MMNNAQSHTHKTDDKMLTSFEAGHLVSVVVPVYNVERYLEQCLTSINSSLGKKLQLIVVNDGSTDSSLTIAERYVAQAQSSTDMPDAQLISKENGGYGAAVNAGFAVADGLYLGIVEPDDYLDGDLFGELFAIAQACDFPDIVKSTYKRVWMPDTSEQRIWYSLLRHRGVRTWQNGTTTLGESPQLVRWHPSVWSAIYRRDFLQETNTRFIEAPGAGWVDNPFVMRAMCQARCIAYTDDAWYCYREDRPGSSSVVKSADLALVRWLQMADEVAASPWSHDPGVLASLASIAFRHASHLWDTAALDDPHVSELLHDVFERISPQTVASLKDISPAVKQRYAVETNALIPKQRGEVCSYYLALAQELVYSWKENGWYFACERAGLHRHAAQKPNA